MRTQGWCVKPNELVHCECFHVLNPIQEAKKTARAARFGFQNVGEKPHASNTKPSLDPAEEEKKRKRAERFGLTKAEGVGGLVPIDDYLELTFRKARHEEI